jgi:hypothetical protein
LADLNAPSAIFGRYRFLEDVCFALRIGGEATPQNRCLVSPLMVWEGKTKETVRIVKSKIWWNSPPDKKFKRT